MVPVEAAEHFHVTLAFLESAPYRCVDDLIEGLGRAAARRPAFEARIASGGGFPDPAHARVLYAGPVWLSAASASDPT